MDIDVFIFNYKKYYDAIRLYDTFTKLGYNTYLLNCESPTDPPFKTTDTVIKLPNIFYSGQWNESLKLVKGDVLFLINSDVRIPKPKVVMRRLEQFYKYYGDKAGIYAPNHYWTPWTYNPNLLETVKFGLKKVPATDSTLWSLSRNIAERIGQIDTGINALGWGIEIVAAYYCFLQKKLVVRDYHVFCEHPQNTSYNRHHADTQFRTWVNTIGLASADFWKYYHSRIRYEFGWHGHYIPPEPDVELKLL